MIGYSGVFWCWAEACTDKSIRWAARLCQSAPAPNADLPIPASPVISTVCPWPVFASSHASSNWPISATLLTIGKHCVRLRDAPRYRQRLSQDEEDFNFPRQSFERAHPERSQGEFPA